MHEKGAQRAPFSCIKKMEVSNSKDTAGAVSRGEVRPVDARPRADRSGAEKESPPRYCPFFNEEGKRLHNEFIRYWRSASSLSIGT